MTMWFPTKVSEQVLASECSSSEEDEEDEDQAVTEEEFEKSMFAVERFVQHNSHEFGAKTVSNVFNIK